VLANNIFKKALPEKQIEKNIKTLMDEIRLNQPKNRNVEIQLKSLISILKLEKDLSKYLKHIKQD
jgi:hypothetical protein